MTISAAQAHASSSQVVDRRPGGNQAFCAMDSYRCKCGTAFTIRSYLDNHRRLCQAAVVADSPSVDPLLAEMESVMGRSADAVEPSTAAEHSMHSPPKRTGGGGLENAVLSAIAEGDETLMAAYRELPVDRETGSRRLTRSIVEAVSSKSTEGVRQLLAALDRAQVVSICFLVDTTGSMARYIDAVREQIAGIVRSVEGSGCTVAGLAFVGYKDWCDGPDHFEVLPFTGDTEAFKTFVSGITATGGGDTPEDVVGGLDRAVGLHWPPKSGARVIYHVGDAPPHGNPKYHTHADSFPDGHPRDKPLDGVFGAMQRNDIMYNFCRVNDLCDNMIQVFQQHCEHRIDVYELTSVAAISTTVVSAVASTVTASSRASVSLWRHGALKSRPFRMNQREPDWSLVPALDATILHFDLPGSVDMITSFRPLEDYRDSWSIKIAPDPFAKGSLRLAYYGKILAAKEMDVVFKELVAVSSVPELDQSRYVSDLETQTVAAKLAQDFNRDIARGLPALGSRSVRLEFLMAKVVTIFLADGSQRYMALEQRLAPNLEMVKYTNNLNYVLPAESLDEEGRNKVDLVVAFSHFTYAITDGYLLVCDLQGMSTTDSDCQPILLLTDPAIHCSRHMRFGKTNLQDVGIKQFFDRHVCNRYCTALGLEKPTLSD